MEEVVVEPPVACVVCGGTAVELVLDLGCTALANKFLATSELGRPEPVYPLRLGYCRECTHVQLLDRVPPSAMFTDYLYMSSASDTLKAHLWSLSDVVQRRARLTASDLVIDIGCNDGTLLDGFARYGVRLLGVDPAKNLAEITRSKRVERYIGFFNAETACEIVQRWGRASAVTATNTFPHIPKLEDFLTGIEHVLAPGGVFVIEAHYLMDLLDRCAFDTVYHEHVSYWALAPMQRLFARHGMQVVDVERLPIHHGQLRVFVQRRGEGTVQPRVAELLDLERVRGLNRFETYQRFAGQAQRIKRELRQTLSRLAAQGKRLAGYGAPAKASTLLGFVGIGPERLAYIADNNPLKQGRYIPGVRIPVVPPARILEDPPDYLLLLAWNFTDEIMRQQAEYRTRGGKFIIPVPEVQYL
ncbi:MAG: methyltransferase domain-containing protein [Candidatus Omnitrophica bacterium]|nr:methyltransferase domain-containing protein [Candidatus Omnitrophota bacterium]